MITFLTVLLFIVGYTYAYDKNMHGVLFTMFGIILINLENIISLF